ncbi:MAG: hypothetical protein LBC41_15770, partial [Clostridiales bacterium]|jgi:DEAD/DEAH box helicase domain-containing protein|nr:hypothetical protein [Clostridiales bacterium]
MKRNALVSSGQFRVWCLSWKDVQNVFTPQDDGYYTHTLQLDKNPSIDAMYKRIRVSVGASTSLMPDKPQMEHLLSYLSDPNAETNFIDQARAIAIAILSSNSKSKFTDWKLRMSEIDEALGRDCADYSADSYRYSIWKRRASNSHFSAYFGVKISELNKKNKSTIISNAVLDDRNDESRTDFYEAEWNGFLHFINIMQFLPQFAAVSVTGLQEMAYSAIPAALAAPETQSSLWQDTFKQLLDDVTKAFATRCIEAGIPEPSSVGYELADNTGTVVAEAEMVWESMKIAFLTPDQEGEKETFESKGWTVLLADDTINRATFALEEAL